MSITDAQREHAARALCRKAGYPEDTVFDGQPAWAWYLSQVDTVLETTLSPEELARLGDGAKAIRLTIDDDRDIAVELVYTAEHPETFTKTEMAAMWNPG